LAQARDAWQNPRLVAPTSKPVYVVRYASSAALIEDHASYITHGGMIVPPCDDPPAANTVVRLRVQVGEGGAYFDFPSRVVRDMPDGGWMVAFEPEARASQVALDELVASEAFQVRAATETPAAGPAKTAHPFEAEPKVHSAPASEPLPTAEPGDSMPFYAVTFASVQDFNEFAGDFGDTAQLTIPHAEVAASAGSPARLKLTLPGHNIFEMAAALVAVDADSVRLRVDPSDPQFAGAAAYPRTTAGQKRLASERPEDRGPTKVVRVAYDRTLEDDSQMPLRRRIGRMGMEEKINLARSGEREARMTLAQDGNKAIHHYLLRNQRITADEIAMMARSPNTNPDVLVKIAENPQYTQNPQIAKNLVFNPKTPLKVSTRLLDRLPRNDVLMISKRTNMHRRLVVAAQKKLARRR